MNQDLSGELDKTELAQLAEWQNARSKRTIPLKFLLLIMLAIPVFSLVVMLLWNGLMPAIFGLRTVGFWQAMGILVLSKILFGGFRGGSRGDTRRDRRMRERWQNMTPEERQKVVEAMRARSRFGPTSEAATKGPE